MHELVGQRVDEGVRVRRLFARDRARVGRVQPRDAAGEHAPVGRIAGATA